jgi:nucleoside-diphosphate-sugar epimerase
MQIIITGGAGFLGQKLAVALARKGTLTDINSEVRELTEIVLLDTHEVAPKQIGDVVIRSVKADICDPASVSEHITEQTGSVYHLAAVVSAQAEADFDLGMRVNLDGTRNLLEACRVLPSPIKFVTTSSVASYGGDMPDIIPDDFSQMPQNSYGMQKAVSELLVNDYSRRGFIDGRVGRLPTIIVRPGKPNAAASSFASSIIREPLQGDAAICPVDKDVPLWVMSPRRVIESLIDIHELDAHAFGTSRSIMLPGISVTAGDMVAALETVSGKEVSDRVTWAFDPTTNDIVSGWPGAFEAARARAMGFKADENIAEIIQAFIQDDLVK